MRTHKLIASTLFDLVFVGCAGTPTVFNKNEQRSLEAIALLTIDPSYRGTQAGS